jgi:hypothetical protein
MKFYSSRKKHCNFGFTEATLISEGFAAVITTPDTLFWLQKT